ncbi:MAG TPA: single-stranded DNA-binding protein [Mycobacteriales bacterium]|nr:single-stranded DNA-binding protein [Mycobacteriales bacterium]
MGAGKRSRAAKALDDTDAGTPVAGVELETQNEVVLVGRVAAPAEERTLPSGDVITTWRLVVDRPRGGRAVPEGVRPSTVDTLNCVTWAAGPRRTARGLAAGDVVRVSGALRRRFWRAGAGAVSRCEVEVDAVKRLARAPR